MSAEMIARLEAATEETQRADVQAALYFAQKRRWITFETWNRASAWAESGAYESAALTLVPEGLDVEILILVNDGAVRAEVQIYPKAFAVCRDDEHIYGEGKTPALALCIAALKLRSA